ncbi:ZPR1 zinc finger domain-containing protein [Candidatus Woesearchaeota archaeon]|nr:MAG: ZPR1 zinc finger domain-containing protein [Candidatus Woesearchaeota archaeon]
MEKLENQKCPMCFKDTCTLTEEEVDVPYFGKVYLFGMQCSDCGFKMSDLEAEENKGPITIKIETSSPEDLNIRVVKSGAATIKIPTLKTTISPGNTPEGYISNIEGVLKRVKKVIEEQRDLASADGDKAAKTRAKNLLKKIWKIECGDLPVKIIIEDPTGNSAIVSDKAVVEKLKKK